MKILTKIFCALMLLIAAGACSHDDPVGREPLVPSDDAFDGDTGEFELGPEAEGFTASTFTLALEAPDGSVIRREGSHARRSGRSRLELRSGLADGVYRLLFLEYPIADNPALADLADTFDTAQFGLGSRIDVKGGQVTVLDHYDEEFGLPGRGTADEPYEISSYNSLLKLAQLVNSEETNPLITPETHFRQTGRIDLYQASREADRRYGWLPIGANSALPFRGHYHGGALSTLIIDRPNTAGVGLFGFVNDAAIYDVKMSNSAVGGNFAVGAIVGASVVSSASRGLVTLLGCSVEGCEVTGSDQSVSVGALLGMVDMHSRAYLQDCASKDNTVMATYNAGGLIGGGGLYSALALAGCTNSSAVTSTLSGAGGLIGTADTIQAATSKNQGLIRSVDSKAIGTGGLIGGAGTATVTSCTNTGKVEGSLGVGGLVGSTRVKGGGGEAYMYGNTVFRYCANEGAVSGTRGVGGIAGEAQLGTYAVYNKGAVSGSEHVGGIGGATSIAVAHNAINLGRISGEECVGGIVASTTFGSIALNHNYGEVIGTRDRVGGIAGLTGNNTIMNCCGNYGKISGAGATGGLVGEVGDPREWTAGAITDCVIGSMECIMGIVGPVLAVAGHSIEAVSEALEIYLHIAETTTDSGLLMADTFLFTTGVVSMIDEASLAELSTEITQEVNEVNTAVKATMAQQRRNFSFTLKDFNHSPLESASPAFIDDALAFYESEGGDEKFNEAIGLVREEREEYLEKVHETNEIIHQVVSGVCIVVGTVAAIGGMVATGGLAAPFIAAGAVASLAGGLNAITKSCMEFEENVVVISQCVNAGSVWAPSGANVAGLVGKLNDNSILRDCLNAGNGPGYGAPFAASTGNSVKQYRLVSLAEYTTWSEITGVVTRAGRVVWNPKASTHDVGAMWNGPKVLVVTDKADIVNPATYTALDDEWSFDGERALWNIPRATDSSFPIPGYSEMKYID